MSYYEHGGNCCGLSHVFDFPQRPNTVWLDGEIAGAIEEIESQNLEMVGTGYRQNWRGAFGHAIEVCLTDDQMKVWAPILKAKGFRLCLRWLNDNSGNYCNLLAWAPKKPSTPRPYKW